MCSRIRQAFAKFVAVSIVAEGQEGDLTLNLTFAEALEAAYLMFLCVYLLSLHDISRR